MLQVRKSEFEKFGFKKLDVGKYEKFFSKVAYAKIFWSDENSTWDVLVEQKEHNFDCVIVARHHPDNNGWREAIMDAAFYAGQEELKRSKK